MDKRLMMAAGAMAFGLASTASPPAHSDTLVSCLHESQRN